jgi:cytochrome c oxidase assembly factor CtaG
MFYYYIMIFFIYLIAIINNIFKYINSIHPFMKLTLFLIAMFVFCVFLSKYILTNTV